MSLSSYADGLHAAWADHLAPRAADAPTVVSTFAGCGGSSLGYSMAGFHELLAVEWDEHAVACFRANFPDVPVYHGDICKLSVEDVLARTGLKPGELDVFDGSPPCQGFSTAGKRVFGDSRNQLFREYCRLLRGLQPRAFVMENVSGMVKGSMKLIFAECLRELKACGYAVSARLLQAEFFGVPQARSRMIFVGTRADLGVPPTHPVAETAQITLRAALARPDTRDVLGRPLSPLQVKRWAETKQGGAHHERFSLKRLAWDRPVNTLLKVPGSGGHMHPDEPRLLSVGELKRVSSFPDEYAFRGSWLDATNRMGNCVPPLLMRAVARHIRERILQK